MARRSTWRGTLLAAAACAAASVAAAPAVAAERVALLLAPPPEQAPVSLSSVADGLTALGFAVTSDTIDRTGALFGALARFERDARDADIAVVIYAGDVAVWNGRFFLTPPNAAIARGADLARSGAAFELFVATAGQARAGAALALAAPAATGGPEGVVFGGCAGATPPPGALAVVGSTRAAPALAAALSAETVTFSGLAAALMDGGDSCLGGLGSPVFLRTAAPEPAAPATDAQTAPPQDGETPAAPTPAGALAAEPVASDPVASESVASDPVASEPFASAPVPSQPNSGGDEADASARETEPLLAAVDAAEPPQTPQQTQPAPERETRPVSPAEPQQTVTAAPAPEATPQATPLSRRERLAAAENALSLPQKVVVEENLVARGLLRGEADGRFDALTRSAIRQLQVDRRLEVTGFLSRELARELSRP